MPIRLAVEAGEHTQTLALEYNIKGVPVHLPELLSDAKKLSDDLATNGLQACQIGAFSYNPLHPDTSERESSSAQLAKAIPLAHELGFPYFVFSAGNRNPNLFGETDPFNQTEEALDLIAAELKPLLEIAEAEGAYLSIEPYLKSAISSPERFLALKDRVDSDHLKVNLDVTSFYNYEDMLDPRPKIRHVCSSLKDHYGLVHLKELTLKPGFHIHIDLVAHDQGPTPWDLVLAEAAPHIPTDSWVLIEHIPNLEDGRRTIPDILKLADRVFS